MILSTTFVRKCSHSENISVRYYHRCILVKMEVKIEVKVKFTLEQATKAQRGSKV